MRVIFNTNEQQRKRWDRYVAGMRGDIKYAYFKNFSQKNRMGVTAIYT
jgi:hypothetical protein